MARTRCFRRCFRSQSTQAPRDDDRAGTGPATPKPSQAVPGAVSLESRSQCQQNVGSCEELSRNSPKVIRHTAASCQETRRTSPHSAIPQGPLPPATWHADKDSSIIGKGVCDGRGLYSLTQTRKVGNGHWGQELSGKAHEACEGD